MGASDVCGVRVGTVTWNEIGIIGTFMYGILCLRLKVWFLPYGQKSTSGQQ